MVVLSGAGAGGGAGRRILGPLIERVLLKRVEKQEPVLQLLVTFALFMILEDAQKLIWGVQPVSNDTPMRLLGTIDVPFGSDVIPFTAYQLFVLPGIALSRPWSASPGSCGGP
jgi:branched-chain amino acid transport system permease protein